MKNKRGLIVFALTVLIILSCRSTDLIAEGRRSAQAATSTPTVRATFTPKPTATLISLPTNTSTRTRLPPTRTRPPTLVPTPTTAPPQATRSPYSFRVDQIKCRHSGQAFVEGLVLENSNINSGINGLKVRMSTEPNGPPAGPDDTTREHDLDGYRGIYSGYFSFIVNAFGAAPGQVRYVWVVDSQGKALSDPSAGKAVFNNLLGDNACWNIQIFFVRFQ